MFYENSESSLENLNNNKVPTSVFRQELVTWEHTENGKTWYGPGTVLHKKATDLHRLELKPNSIDTWTLFIPGKRCREWGFKTDKGWIEEKKYLEERKKKDN